MAICNGDQYVQNIERTECIGNSLVKINNNFAALDVAVCETGNDIEGLLTLINQLSANQLITQYEAVIGSAETTYGALSSGIKAVGVTQNTGSRLVDFNYQKANGTSVLYRTENVTNFNTFKPWNDFFPYKPTLPNKTLVRSKFDVRQPCNDASSGEDQNYSLVIDWQSNEAILTGTYVGEGFGETNRVFIKKWNFSNGNEIEIRCDSNAASPRVNQLGEMSVNTAAESYSYAAIMKCKISPANGVESLPLWTYWGGGVAGSDTRTILQETAGNSILIENTFK